MSIEYHEDDDEGDHGTQRGVRSYGFSVITIKFITVACFALAKELLFFGGKKS